MDKKMTDKTGEQARKEIAGFLYSFLHSYQLTENVCQITANEIIDKIESLGYTHSKVSKDLEQAITELAGLICLELTGSKEGNKEGQKEFIEELIRQWLSANRLVQLDPNQDLPDAIQYFCNVRNGVCPLLKENFKRILREG